MALRLAILLLCVAPPLRAELSPEEWQRLRREASELARKPGEADRKIALLETASDEDSARAAKLLLEMAAASLAQSAKIAPRLEKAERDFAKTNKQLRKKLGYKSSRKDFEKDSRWRTRRDAVKQLTAEIEVEAMLVASIGDAIGNLRSSEAIAVLVDGSDRVAKQARRSLHVRNGILQALWKQNADSVVNHILAFGMDPGMPEARARILHWIGARKVREGYDVAVAGLRAKESAVARSAVAALQSLNDPRCVPDLVMGRKKASGLLAEELELALHFFTGKTFFGVGADAMWSGWWKSEGEAWLESVQARRFGAADLERKGKAAFYGISTRSNRIVFVLDRSGSMKHPVPQRGTVTGKKRDARVAGETKLEVAKTELIRTIRNLPPDVKFAVVFFSHDVHVWKDPPAMMPATAENKKEAIDWFRELDPVGSTMTFDALEKTLRYAKVGGGKSSTDPRGADTIFLLSDGSPSTPDGDAPLPEAERRKAVRAFLEANRPFRCVVHTIGVGPEHNRELMQSLASATGGTYKAVGVR
ncbi:MAG: VWA domain-containing protein [Planctomycetota bacterium]